MVQQRKIAKYVLLQIVTLGIYGLFFWSDWTEDVNKMCEDDNKERANYILVFVLDIFTFGIFSLIWNYSMSERMYRIAPKYGIELKYGGSRVLLLRTILFFLPVFGSVAKLKMFNTLAVAYNATLDEEEIVLSTMKEKKPKKETKAEKKASKKAAKKGAVAEDGHFLTSDKYEYSAHYISSTTIINEINKFYFLLTPVFFPVIPKREKIYKHLLIHHRKLENAQLDIYENMKKIYKKL